MANFISEDQIELALLQRGRSIDAPERSALGNCNNEYLDVSQLWVRGDKGRPAAALLEPGDASFDGYPDESLAERQGGMGRRDSL